MKRTRLYNYIRNMRAWRQIVLAIAIIVTVMVSGFLLLHSGTENTTKFTADITTPSVAHFTDDASFAFISSDNIPDINNNRTISNISPLDISYEWESGPYSDPFRANLTPGEIAGAVKISPFIRGNWKIRDNSLIFTPDNDWPANTKFTVKIGKSLFNTDAIPNTRKISFRTPNITAKIDSFNIYPDAGAPKSMVAIAVISFNYPIDTANFGDKVSLRLDDKKLDFSVKFDKFYRTAFITSAPITVTDAAQTIRLKLNRVTAQSGDCATKKLTGHTVVESADNIFKITDVITTIADTTDDNAQQLILINTSAATQKNTKWTDYVNVYLLPRDIADSTDNATDAHHWQLDEVTPAIIAKAQKIKITPIDFATPSGMYQYAFAYSVNDEDDRYIYVSVKSGMTSLGQYTMHNGIEKVMHVPAPEKSVKIAGNGAILSMTGDKKLGIMARGGADSAHAIMYKIKSSEINHLISQTYDLFSQNLEFKSWSFGKYDMSMVFQKTIPFANTEPMRTNYASLDLGEYLDRSGTDKTGIFIIQVGANKTDAENNDQRLILLTDMGIIRKINTDGTSSLFVTNISMGTPAADVEISVLARNGNPIWAGRTDENGHAEIPQFAWSEYKNARQPIAIIARQDNDISFIPYNSEYALRVEYSKFDIDGEYASNDTAMNAYMFSDRGIYRPGEPATITTIIKNKHFKSLAGVPVKLILRDSRGREIMSKSVSLDASGMFDVKYKIPSDAAVGTYTINAFSLSAKNKNQDWLGTTTFQVAEFSPDTMKISVTVADNTDTGWISPDGITATVFLQNLFGTPASNKRISATATLRPTEFDFPEYKSYTFGQTSTSNNGVSSGAPIRAQTYTVEIPDAQTDEAGMAKLEINFPPEIRPGTYILTLDVRGFESDSGKSVRTAIVTRASNEKYLLGFSASADLSYINRNAASTVRLIALDNTATPINVENLNQKLIKRENLTSLIKDANGYYKYQTVTRDTLVSTKPINISKNGTNIELDTDNGGTYFVQITDASDNILTNIEYFVAASENLTLAPEQNAEMKIKLDRAKYRPGDTISVHITTPYAGAGLITIERDKVYAYKWFKSNTSSSVQQIIIPENFEGNGYINVSFVRDIASHDIFTTPYAFAVSPFKMDTTAHEIDIELSAPKKIDSNKLTIEYTTNQDAKIIIFAVNTGILQVAKYKIPNPIAHFFQKSALQVETFQTLSLLLPEYKILREFAKTGGSDYASEIDDALSHTLTNPFARRISAPVAFASEIISATAHTPGQITFDIPEEFNGDITTFAVASNAIAMGAANTHTHIQSPVIVSTAMPTFAAPTDTFKVTSVISNLAPASGPDAHVQLSATTTDNLTITGMRDLNLALPENTDKVTEFDIVIGHGIGNAELNISANLTNANDEIIATRKSVNTMSVRPITTYQTRIHTGEIKSSTETIKDFSINMYRGTGNITLYISQNADVAIRPLFQYLASYDFDCTEQLVSRAIPFAIMPNNKFIGTTRATSNDKITETINTLKNRQNDDGSFNLWTGGARGINNTSDARTTYLTAYVTQFLILAKSNGFTVPKEILSRATDYLRSAVGTQIQDPVHAAAIAYAIYVTTLGGYVTTSYINTFEEYANANIKSWQSGIMGAYIAASYKLLKQSDKATTLISKYRVSDTDKFVYNNIFDNNVTRDAIYTYLMGRHFGSAPSGISKTISAYINSGNYSAYTSALVIMGLAGANTENTDLVKGITTTVDGTQITGTMLSNTYIADISDDADKIVIKCPKCGRNARLNYTIVQQGYPTKTTAATHGLDIVREYYSSDGRRITSANIGDIVTVKIFARTRGATEYIQNVAITDLMPGGFIADTDSLTGDTQYFEFREDRVIIYTDLSRTTREITYTAQVGAAGVFAIAPIYGESMYNPQINATGPRGTFTVSNATKD